MKFILLLLPAITACFSIQAQQPDRKTAELKGNVSSVRVSGKSRYYSYSKNSFSPWQKSAAEITSFDRTGRTVEYQKLDSNGILYYKIKYSYNPKDRNAQMQYFDKNDQPSSKELWKYDNKDQKTEEQKLSKDGTLNYRYTYTYDAAGNVAVKTTYYPDGKIIDKTTYTYDSKNHPLSEVVEGSAGVQSNHRFSYDKSGNRTGEIWYDTKNEVDFRMVYAYDAQGNMTRLSKYKRDSEVEWSTGAWKYEYDKQGNWTKKTGLDADGNETSVTERVLAYY